MSNRFTKYTADKLRADGWLDKEQADTLRTRLQQVEIERDAAIKEANRRDQKWMDGINEAVGRKLDYGDPCSRDNASKALGQIVAERDKAEATVKGWIKENGPGGWIDKLRDDNKSLLERLKEADLLLGETMFNWTTNYYSLDWIVRRDTFLNPKPQDVM